MVVVSPLVEFDLPAQSGDGPAWESANLSVNHDGTVVHLIRQMVRTRTVGDGFAEFPLTQSTRHQYRAQTWKNHHVTEYDLGFHAQVYHRYIPLIDGKGLLVCDRCQRFTDGTVEMNATIIYIADGSRIRQMTLGDGINAVNVTPNGVIWCGFMDEGIFGNYGWGGSGGSRPLGASGLVAYNNEGSCLYEFSAPSHDGETDLKISDCYVLNAIGEEVWICPYTDFPLIRIDRSGDVQWWKKPKNISQVDAFAISNSRVLIFDRRKLFLVSLENNHETRLLRTYDLPFIGDLATVECRGNAIYVMQGTSVSRILVPLD
jgi:hypothetical protein